MKKYIRVDEAGNVEAPGFAWRVVAASHRQHNRFGVNVNSTVVYDLVVRHWLESQSHEHLPHTDCLGVVEVFEREVCTTLKYAPTPTTIDFTNDGIITTFSPNA